MSCPPGHDHELEPPPLRQRADAVEERREIGVDIDRMLLGSQVVRVREHDQEAEDRVIGRIRIDGFGGDVAREGQPGGDRERPVFSVHDNVGALPAEPMLVLAFSVRPHLEPQANPHRPLEQPARLAERVHDRRVEEDLPQPLAVLAWVLLGLGELRVVDRRFAAPGARPSIVASTSCVLCMPSLDVFLARRNWIWRSVRSAIAQTPYPLANVVDPECVAASLRRNAKRSRPSATLVHPRHRYARPEVTHLCRSTASPNCPYSAAGAGNSCMGTP